MSFDFSTLPTQTDFISANPTPSISSPTEQETYDQRVERVQKRVLRFFNKTNSRNRTLKVRIGFLTTDDKTSFQSGIEGKGFTCVEQNGFMIIN